jgi:hypothetical protein
MEAVKTLAKICSHMVHPPDTWASMRQIAIGSRQTQTKLTFLLSPPMAVNQAAIVPAGIVPGWSK